MAYASIAVSIGLWVIGVRWMLSAQAAAVERLPDSWRRTAPDEYAAMGSMRLWDVLRNSRGHLPMVAVGVFFFGLLAAVDVSLAVQLGFAAALALAWTRSLVNDQRRERDAYQREDGLDALPPDRALLRRYCGALFVCCLGLLLFCLSVAQAGEAVASPAASTVTERR